MNLAIHGVGVHLPPEIRTNDWWPAEITDRWMAARARAAEQPVEVQNAGHAAVLQAIARYADDPFAGAVSRHVLAPDLLPSDMEALAAREAMDRAGVKPEEIDFILEYSICPDYLADPNACVVHHKIGLSPRCLSISINSVCNAFMHQMHLAQRLLSSGYKRGLLVQSSVTSRIVAKEAPFAPWFGDGATAVVVGHPKREGQGLLADAHRTESALHSSLVIGIRGSFWHEDGPARTYITDPSKNQRLFAQLPSRGEEVVNAALAEAGLSAGDVDFYASHQGTVWFREVTQEVLGLQHTRSVDSFPWAGSLSAANLPLVLATAEREGKLHEGDLVAFYAGGSGVTFGGAVMRW